LTVKGQPISKIFVKTTIADKQLVSVRACHELFEMVIDPVANLWAQAAPIIWAACSPLTVTTCG
jgi:hypothetical protein